MTSKAKSQTTEIAELKQRYVDYYSEVPVQRYAAMHIARSEDTIIRWRDADANFAEQVQMAKSDWIKKKIGKSPPAWVLERLEREIFAPPTQKFQGEVDVNSVEKIIKETGLRADIEKERASNDRKSDEDISGSSKDQA